MSKFATSFTDSLYEVMKAEFHRGATLYENTDGSWTWKVKGITKPTLLELKSHIDSVYDAIAQSIRTAKN